MAMKAPESKRAKCPECGKFHEWERRMELCSNRHCCGRRYPDQAQWAWLTRECQSEQAKDGRLMAVWPEPKKKRGKKDDDDTGNNRLGLAI